MYTADDPQAFQSFKKKKTHRERNVTYEKEKLAV